MPTARTRSLLLAAAVAATVCAPAAATSQSSGSTPSARAAAQEVAEASGPERRVPVMFVGNNWDGTVDLLNARTFVKRQRINVVPDLEEVVAAMTPDERAAMLVIREQAGEGHDQLVDDIAVSPGGRRMYVSRPSLGDIAAFRIVDGTQLWRTEVDGYRSDHMALSPDGDTLVVSATTANVVDVVDAQTGAIRSSFPTGDFPHENQFSADGDTLYNATIGRVIAPDDPEADAGKGVRNLSIVDAETMTVRRVIEFKRGIRPFVVMPNGRTMYAQLSFLNGFVKYDLAAEGISRRVRLPLSEQAQQMEREDYPLDSAHHGLTLNGDRTKLCVAGTISDYAAIITLRGLTTDRIVRVGKKPYWAATSPSGRYCFLSNSDSDDISVVTFNNPREVARIPVGDHPQRVRAYTVPRDVLGSWGRRPDLSS